MSAALKLKSLQNFYTCDVIKVVSIHRLEFLGLFFFVHKTQKSTFRAWLKLEK